MRVFLSEVAYAARLLRRNPGFAAVALLSMALGIGANTAVFSVAHSLLLRPLPFPEPDRLVSLSKTRTRDGARAWVSWPELDEWGAQKNIFVGVAGYRHEVNFAVSGQESDSQPVNRILVTQGFFEMLGRQPALGRLFTDDEWTPTERGASSAPRPVVITWGLWQSRFGGKDDVLGQILKVDGDPHTVIGVMPRDFRLFRSYRPDLFIPFPAPPSHRTDRGRRYLEAIGRLRPGADFEQARAQMTLLGERAGREDPAAENGQRYHVQALHERLFGKSRPLMLWLMVAVGLVLSIACANTAALLLLRGVRREKEIAVRLALGAGRARVVRLLLAESLLVSLAAGGLGTLLAVWGIDAFTAFAGSLGMGLPEFGIDATVLAFTAAVSLFSGLLFGLFPALHGSRVNLSDSLKSAGGASSPGASSHRWCDALVIAEIALSLVVLIGAGLAVRSLIALARVRPGFDAAHVLTMAIGRTPGTPDFVERGARFWPQLLDRVGSLPGVQAAAASHDFPMSSDQTAMNHRVPVTVKERQLPPPGLPVEYQSVSPDYFRVMGIPLVKGRLFGPGDVPDGSAPSVAIINQTLARDLWGSDDPIGRQLITFLGSYTVVGVVGDVRQHGPRLPAPPAQVYEPLWYANFFKIGTNYLLARVQSDPRMLANAIKAEVRALDPDRTVNLVRTVEQVALERTAWERLSVLVAGLFGAIAVLLTTVGMYAVVAHAVSLRTREIGIRIALGSRPAGIFGAVLRWGLALVLAGAAAGLATAFVLTRYLGSLLYGVGPADGLTYTASCALMGIVAGAACYFPARSATRVDPVAALRSE